MSSVTKTEIPGGAVRSALQRAAAHAGTAAVAALLAPLVVAPASAAIATINYTNITSSAGAPVNGVTTFTYVVSDSPSAGEVIYEFELPEVNAGDFNLQSLVVNNAGTNGWTATQSASATFATTGFKVPSTVPGAYILFHTTSNPISEGSTYNFSLTTTTLGTLNANFTTASGFPGNSSINRTETVDPIVPAGVRAQSVVPEPPVTALILGGLTAALALSRRKKV